MAGAAHAPARPPAVIACVGHCAAPHPRYPLRSLQTAAPPHLQGLVDVAHVLRLHIGVLLACPNQLWEGRQQPLYPDAAHVHKLPRYQGCSQGGDTGQDVGRCLLGSRSQVAVIAPHNQPCHATGAATSPSTAPPLPFLVTMLAARTTMVARLPLPQPNWVLGAGNFVVTWGLACLLHHSPGHSADRSSAHWLVEEVGWQPQRWLGYSLGSAARSTKVGEANRLVQSGRARVPGTCSSTSSCWAWAVPGTAHRHPLLHASC